MTPRVEIKRLRPDAIVPQYQTELAAGLDVHACITESITIEPGRRAAIGTGLAIALPPGYEAQVRPRSGLARSHGVTLVNAPGTIDADYRGEVTILLINHGSEALTLKAGERIAQLVIAPVARATLVEVDELSATARGEGGFGSTGR